VRQFPPVARDPAIENIRHELARLRPAASGTIPPGRRAAVAAVLQERGGTAEVLFIHRAEHPRDPWSGQMAWPGGRIEAGDAGPLAAAVRETREELGLDLETGAELLGQLTEVRTHIRQGPGPLSVVPFVFQVHAGPVLVPNSEVQEALWVPLRFFRERENRGRFIWTGRGVPLVMPCYRYNGHVIWGLTLRMLDELLRLFAGDG
jgi:8-oxo-dGTP pyrophosphatase MutT (NUDIX family)